MVIINTCFVIYIVNIIEFRIHDPGIAYWISMIKPVSFIIGGGVFVSSKGDLLSVLSHIAVSMRMELLLAQDTR